MKQKTKEKRLYEVTDPNPYGDLYICFVAYSSAEARSYAFSNENLGGNYGYTEFRVKWRRDIKIAQDTECGELWIEDGMRLGVYGWTEGFPCDDCGKDEGRVSYIKKMDKILCQGCEEKRIAKITLPPTP